MQHSSRACAPRCVAGMGGSSLSGVRSTAGGTWGVSVHMSHFITRRPGWTSARQGPLIASADRCWADGQTEHGAWACFCVCHSGSEKAEHLACGGCCLQGWGLGSHGAVDIGEGQGRGPLWVMALPFPDKA